MAAMAAAMLSCGGGMPGNPGGCIPKGGGSPRGGREDTEVGGILGAGRRFKSEKPYHTHTYVGNLRGSKGNLLDEDGLKVGE